MQPRVEDQGRQNEIFLGKLTAKYTEKWFIRPVLPVTILAEFVGILTAYQIGSKTIQK